MVLYHLTPKFLGAKCFLKPKSHGDNNPDRICTTPSVAQCLLAIPMDSLNGTPLKVYKCNTTEYISAGHAEFDTSITKEKWILTPQKFKLVATLNSEISLFIRSFVYADNSGIEDNHLSRRDRLVLLRIRLRAIRSFLKTYKHWIYPLES
jgi:hypothetical protein